MNPNDLPPQVLVHLVHAATEIFPDHFRVDCCLNATRVCIDALKAFGIVATPLSVDAMYMNRIYVAKLAMHASLPDAETADAWTREGAWALGIDTKNEAEPDKWAGHLVAIVKGWILDGSSGQFARPAHAMNVAPVFAGRVMPRFLKGKGAVLYQMNDGSQLSYYARVSDKSYRLLSGFSAHEDNAKITKLVIERMREKIARLEENAETFRRGAEAILTK